MTNIAIIFAGGVGQRLISAEKIPKQFLKINEKPIIVHTLELFQQNKNIDKIYIAIHPDYYEYMQELIKYYHISKVKGVVNGGKTGQHSIYNALKLAQSENPDDSIVLVHDGVRPNVTQEVINNNILFAEKTGSAITCTPCFETILISKNGMTPSSVPYRNETFAAQAPQTFRLGEIIDIHERERKENPDYVDIIDSCTLFKKQGHDVTMIRGNLGNIKITTVVDLYVLRAIIRYKEDLEAFGIDKVETFAK